MIAYCILDAQDSTLLLNFIGNPIVFLSPENSFKFIVDQNVYTGDNLAKWAFGLQVVEVDISITKSLGSYLFHVKCELEKRGIFTEHNIEHHELKIGGVTIRADQYVFYHDDKLTINQTFRTIDELVVLIQSVK